MVDNAPWLDVLRSRLGVQEIPGEQNNIVILEWFAAVGHPEVHADEVSWCAVSVGAALKACSLPIPPREVNMLARSYLSYGVHCEPKPGAIAIWPRGKAWQGHVNVVESVTADGKVICIGGNQSTGKGGDAVTRTKPLDPKAALDFRWPIAATVPELRKAGSTEIAKGDRVQNVGIFTAFFAPIIAVIKELFSHVPDVPHFASIPEGLSFGQQVMEGINAIARLALENPWLAGSVGGGLILAWLGHSIKAARVAKHETGVPLSTAVAAVA
ncbi:MAG: CHAP domain-containing protein [Proteobacteria bacterium]|nr:CHAP domain-containing protein [Pseudomonadota bacterium]